MKSLVFFSHTAGLKPVSGFVILLLVLSGCGGSADDNAAGDGALSSSSSAAPDADDAPNGKATTLDSAPDTPAEPEVKEKAAAAITDSSTATDTDTNATGSFTGTVILEGDVPDLKPLVEAGTVQVKDAEVCAVNAVLDQSLVVGDNQGIANVFVYIRRAPKGYESESPTEPVVVDQQGCVFVPHAVTVRAGQPVLIRSSDAIQHNLHTVPDRNQQTNILISPNEQDGVEITYSRPESGPFNVKCDIHAWMSSYHLVLDHPFMAVTDEQGKFRIDGLPAGSYEFRVWHERGDLLEKALEVDVAAGEPNEVSLTYTADRFGL